MVFSPPLRRLSGADGRGGGHVVMSAPGQFAARTVLLSPIDSITMNKDLLAIVAISRRATSKAHSSDAQLRDHARGHL
jgi:hypothetical protein